MIRRYYIFSLIFLFFGLDTNAQDNCAAAVSLCAGSTITRNTTGATPSGSDPALSCGDAVVNNSLWFTVLAVSAGNCTITVSNINNNPGLDMEVYTGTCSSLTSIGQCASGSSATGGTMSVSFVTIANTTYYVMVDGNGGNQELFDIIATTPDNAIVARPDADFSVNPQNGCIPLSTDLHNNTSLHGGSNITYDWRIDGGSYIPSNGADTTLVFNNVATHSIDFRVCNQQCGCKSVSQDVASQDLFPVVTFTPSVTCIGTSVTFTGSATVQPDPPYVDPNISNLSWDFGDPLSGASNTAAGPSASHTFVGAGPSFSVRLIVLGTCGPDTSFTTVNLLPKPVVTITGPTQLCGGQDLNLSSSVSNATSPIQYTWTGVGSFSCTTCSAPLVTGLSPGGPYSFDLAIVDSNGCVADTSLDVTVYDKPSVFAGGTLVVCASDSAQLNAFAFGGLPPYRYQWTPSAGLNNDTIVNPYTFNTSGTSYCVTVTDANNCSSDPDCVFITQYPQPVITPSSVNLCATSTPLQNTFTVTGPNPGSLYSWTLSPSYSFITNAAIDSSDITADFPPVPGTYDFTTIVTDALTGCVDTVPTSFNITAGLSMVVSGPTVICAGNTATLSVTGANTYFWSASPAYAFADPTDSTQIVSPPVNTIFTIIGTMGTCTQTLDDTLTVGAIPTAAINPIAPFCGCKSITLNGVGSTAGMSYLWTSQNGSTITSATNIVTTAWICVNDSINLLVTDPSTGCFSDSTVGTTANVKPDAVNSVSPNIICDGTSTLITLDGTGSDSNPGTFYHWTSDNPGSVIITDTTALVTTATVSTATIFFLTVTDASGCDSTVTDTVQIYPPPSFSAFFPFICTSDTSLKSTLTISGATPGSTYNWTSVPSCVTPSTASTESQIFDFATCGAGIYNFDVTVTDILTTCVTNVSQTVTVVNGVTLTLSPDASICEGSSVIINASGANSYVWNTGDTTSSFIANNLTASGSPYNFIVTGTIGSCVATDTVVITVNPVPVTNPISGPASVCENDPATVYTDSSSAGNYQWSVIGGVIVAGQGSPNLIVNWNTPGIGFVTVIDSNSFGCFGQMQVLNVIINPLPDTPSVTGPAAVCSNDLSTYFVASNPGSVYNWSITGGTDVTGSNGAVNTFQWGSAGSGILNVYEVSSAGCTGPTANYNVTIHPRPLPVTVIGNTLVCDNLSEIYAIAANPGSIYSWTIINETQVSLNGTTDTMTVDWGNGGTGHVIVFETNSFGCISDTTDKIISINQHPQILIPNDSAVICNNVSYQVISSSSVSNIRWFTDGNGSFSDTTIFLPVYQPSPSDTGYTHLYAVSKNPPCLNDTGRITLYIKQAPVVTITGPAGPVCYGSIDSLKATGGGSYVWLPGGIPGNVIGIRPLTTTTYTVAVTNSFSCTTYDSITVNVIPPGIPDGGSDVVACIGDSVLLNGSQQNAGGLLWSTLGDGTFLPDNVTGTASYVAGTADTTAGFVNIILETTGACLNLKDTVHIIIQRHPSIIAGNDTTLSSSKAAGSTLPLRPIVQNVSGVQWTTNGSGTFTPSDTTLNAVYVPSSADYDLDSIYIIVTTTGSCIPDIDTLVVDFAPFVFPNVFTPYPASPGYNDYFVIRYLTPNCILKVWDRWGSLVYSSDYYQNDWDANGLKADVYYYLVISEDKKYKGWVQVMR